VLDLERFQIAEMTFTVIQNHRYPLGHIWLPSNLHCN